MIRILVSFSLCFTACLAAKRPNILFAFADDWGQQAPIYAEEDTMDSVIPVMELINNLKVTVQLSE